MLWLESQLLVESALICGVKIDFNWEISVFAAFDFWVNSIAEVRVFV